MIIWNYITTIDSSWAKALFSCLIGVLGPVQCRANTLRMYPLDGFRALANPPHHDVELA